MFTGPGLTPAPHYHRIYLVHDDVKERTTGFEVEMSWIGDETEGRRLPVPSHLKEDVERRAKEAIEQFED